MEQFVPRVGLSARSAQSSASPVALVGPCGAVGGRSTGRSPSRCWNGVEPPTLRLAVIVDQAFSNVSYSEPGVNQYNDPARNCQYVPRPGLMSQGELTTYCNSGGPSPPSDTTWFEAAPSRTSPPARPHRSTGEAGHQLGVSGEHRWDHLADRPALEGGSRTPASGPRTTSVRENTGSGDGAGTLRCRSP